MYDRIHWQDGALLTAQHLNKQDQLQQYNALKSIVLPYSMSYGIVQLHIDIGLLEVGTIKINRLKAYTKEHRFVTVEQEQKILFSLDECNTSSVVSIYLNLEEQFTKDGEIEKIVLVPKLSDTFQDNQLESFKLFEVKNRGDSWSLNKFSTALLTSDTCTFASVIDHLEKTMVSLKHFILNYQHNQSTYYTLQIHFHDLQRTFDMVKDNPIHIHPVELFNKVDTVYYLISLVEKAEYTPIKYDFYKPNKSFFAIFNILYERLSKPVKQQLVTFERENNAFIIPQLETSFLNANEYFLVLRKRTQEDTPDININYLKLSSIKRNKHINQMSLSGISLEKMPNNGIHQLGDPFLYQVYKLIHGTELDEVLLERNMMFQYVDNAENYQFVIYYR